MSRVIRSLILCLVCMAGTSLPSCATIAGTAVSPITGGVDLCRETRCAWWTSPFVFLGGAVAGPFVAFYNGVNFDPQVFAHFGAYWQQFDQVFRPFELLNR